MQSKKINKVRTFLLIQTDHEIKEYLKKSFTYINTKSPKDLATQYDNDYVVNFDNSIANNLNMSNTHPLLVPNRKINTSNQKLSRKINIIENDNQKLKDGIENVLRDIGNNFNELDAENKALKEKIKALEKYNSRLRSDIQSINQRYIDLNDKVSRYLNASSLGIWNKIE